MTPRRFYLVTAAIVAVGVFVSVRANADDAGRDWSQSMGYQSASESANAFNSALVTHNLNRGGAGASGSGGTWNCQVAGACLQGGTVTQWNGVSVSSVTGSNGISIDNTIDADSTQDAQVGSCSTESGCVVNLN